MSLKLQTENFKWVPNVEIFDRMLRTKIYEDDDIGYLLHVTM